MKTSAIKYISLLSGGLDSVVNLYAASQAGQVLLALTFDYGQRSAAKEIEAAQFFTSQLGIKHQVIAIPWLKDITNTALVKSDQALPHLNNLDDLAEGDQSAQA